jgi:hypothetical protein
LQQHNQEWEHFVLSRSFLLRQFDHKKRAPSAHVSRFGVCTNGVQDAIGKQAQVYPAASLELARSKKRAQLLRNVNLFLFVYVAEEVYQATDEGNCGQPECDPPRGMTARRIWVGHKPVEVIDCTDGGYYAYQNRQNVFQAFHFDLRASE